MKEEKERTMWINRKMGRRKNRKRFTRHERKSEEEEKEAE